MSQVSTSNQSAMDDPDHGWKPNRRPESIMARNFSAALDDLFRLEDGGLDTLSKNVHQRKQTVTIKSEELEALEARLRETEERLKLAKTSPDTFKRTNSQRRTPAGGAFSDEDESRIRTDSATTDGEPNKSSNMPGALPETPASYNSAEYVLVDRPAASKHNE